MAKLHCDKHKRYVPYCDDCKALAAAAEEAELQAERVALAESPEAEEAEEEEARQGQAVLDDALREEESNALKSAVGFPGFTPETSVDEEPISVFPLEVGSVEEQPQPSIDETEKAMAEDGEFDQPPQPGYIGPPIPPSVTLGPTTDEAYEVLKEIADALDRGEEVTVLFGNAEQGLREAGRKEVIQMVKEWYADGQDTGAFQLLEYLNKKSRLLSVPKK